MNVTVEETNRDKHRWWHWSVAYVDQCDRNAIGMITQRIKTAQCFRCGWHRIKTIEFFKEPEAY